MPTWIESLDVDSYVQMLMQKESAQIDKGTNAKLNMLNSNQIALKSKISNYGQLQSLFNTLQQKIANLNTKFKPVYDVLASNTSVATVAINGQTTPGSHALTVTQLAQGHQVASSIMSVANPNTALNKTNTLTIGVGSTNFNVNVSASDSLQTIANNINSAAAINNVGTFASVINTGTGSYRLVVSSTQTGTANAVNISETGVGADALNISTGVSGTGTVLSQAQNAQFTLDTLSYNVSSNSNSIGGLNITLLSLGSTNISVTEKDPVSGVKQAVQELIDTYNDTMKFIAKTQAQNTIPDPVLPVIQTTLIKSIYQSPVLNKLGITPIPYKEIPPIEVTTAADGSTLPPIYPMLLRIGSDPAGESFETKLTNNFAGVQAELAGTGSPFEQLNTMLTTTTGSLWKVLNDGQYGSLTKAQLQMKDLNEQVNSIKSLADKQKKDLIMRYGQLDLLLNNLKVKSQYLTQQLSVLSSNNK